MTDPQHASNYAHIRVTFDGHVPPGTDVVKLSIAGHPTLGVVEAEFLGELVDGPVADSWSCFGCSAQGWALDMDQALHDHLAHCPESQVKRGVAVRDARDD